MKFLLDTNILCQPHRKQPDAGCEVLWVPTLSLTQIRPSEGWHTGCLTCRSIDQSLNGMETVTISPKFQVVIPQAIREGMGIRSGEKVHVIAYRNRIEIIPVRDIKTLRGFLKGIDTTIVRDEDRV